MAQPTSFDQLFQEMVYDNADNNDVLSTNDGDTVDSFLNSLLSSGPAVPMVDQLISTPTAEIDFPLPDINKTLFENDKVKVEEISEPFDLPAVVKEELVDEKVPDFGSVKMEEEKTEEDEEKTEEDVESDTDWCPTLVEPTSRKRKIKPEVREAMKSLVSSAPSNGKRKRKLYEQKAFRDPVMERNRQNAINAKKNRDRKKKEKEALMTQMDLLRDENTKLRAKVRAQDKVLRKHGLKV